MGASVPDAVGTFPVYSIQELVLAADDDPGPVALVVDVRLVNKLDIDLVRLTTFGLDLRGQRVRWAHGEECRCDQEDPPKGFAGVVRGQVADGQVSLRHRSGDTDAPARCLTPTANRQLIEQYLVRLARIDEAKAHRDLDRVLTQFRSVSAQWEQVTKFAATIGPIELFCGGLSATLNPAMIVAPGKPVGDAWFGPARLVPATEPKLNFRYGTRLLGPASGPGLRRHGPYDLSVERAGRLRALVLAPSAYATEAARLGRTLAAGVSNFRGMEKQFRLDSFEIRSSLFQGTDAASYKAAAIAASSAGVDLVFLIVAHQDRYLPEGCDPYRAAKAILVPRGVPVQSITRENLLKGDDDFRWVVSNMALAAYAKVGNVPFVLHDPTGGREVVLGIGRSDVETGKNGEREQLFGAAVAFRQDGDFVFAGSTVPVADRDRYGSLVEDLVRKAVERYESALEESLDRVTIHIFKRTGRHEVAAATAALAGRRCSFALVHINRDSPLWLVDVMPNGAVRRPVAGTVVALGPRDRLLVTGDGKGKGMPHPLRLQLDRNSTYTDMDRITDQAYGFTVMSWRTHRRTHEPSTVLYGRLLAEKVGALMPYGFDPALASTGIGDKPWFV